MSPAFGVSMLAKYVQVFEKQSKIFVNLLRPKAVSGETFDLWPFLINANIDVITGEKQQLDCEKPCLPDIVRFY